MHSIDEELGIVFRGGHQYVIVHQAYEAVQLILRFYNLLLRASESLLNNCIFRCRVDKIANLLSSQKFKFKMLKIGVVDIAEDFAY